MVDDSNSHADLWSKSFGLVAKAVIFLVVLYVKDNNIARCQITQNLLFLHSFQSDNLQTEKISDNPIFFVHKRFCQFLCATAVPAGTAEVRISYGNSVCLSVRLSVCLSVMTRWYTKPR